MARARLDRESAFTLIELLIVIAMTGILAAIPIQSFNTARADAVDAATTTAAAALMQAATEVRDENARHPASRVTMEAILAKHPKILKHAAPGTVLAIQSNDSSAGYCVTATNPKGYDFISGQPYVLDSALTPMIVGAHKEPVSGACPAGVLSSGLPDEYVVNDDGTITPHSTVDVCGGIAPGPIKRDDVRFDDGHGNYTKVAVDLVLSDDCAHVTGSIRVINPDPDANPNAQWTLPVSTQTVGADGSYLPVTNTNFITITGTAPAQVNLATGFTDGQKNRALYFDTDYRTRDLGQAFLAWQ